MLNRKKQRLACSRWLARGASPARPTVVYAHGNASCRLEAISALPLCLSLGLSVLALDCAGSGHSDGEYVSLGHHEQDDVAAVVTHLSDVLGVAKVRSSSGKDLAS